jgi:hypothetical protein
MLQLTLSQAALLLCCATAYNNGLGRVPALGWSSWYAAPDGSQVTEAFVRANAQVLLDSGLAAKGYVYVKCVLLWLLWPPPHLLPPPGGA